MNTSTAIHTNSNQKLVRSLKWSLYIYYTCMHEYIYCTCIHTSPNQKLMSILK